MLKVAMFSPLSSKLSYWQLLPETLLPPVCWSSSSCLCLPWEGTRQAPASTEEHESLPPTPLGLDRDVSKCFSANPSMLAFDECWWARESKPPGNMECQHHPFPVKECLTHTQCQGKLCDSALSVTTNTTSFPCRALLSKLNRKGITSLPPLKKKLGLVQIEIWVAWTGSNTKSN